MTEISSNALIEMEEGEDIQDFGVQLSKGSPMKRVRKTDFIDYYYCPRKFKMRKKGVDYDKNLLMERGIKFHEFADKFFDLIDIEEVPENSRKETKRYFRSFIPEEFENPLRGWVEEFIEFETRSWMKNRKYFMPVEREYPIEHPDRVMGMKLVGHIDRVDKISPGEVAIIEYKPKASVHKLEVELAFYTSIWNAQVGQSLEATECHCYQYVEGEPVEIKPAYKRMVRTLKDMKKSIKNDTFKKNYNSCSYCWFRDECLDEEEIERLLEGDRIED